MAAKDGPVLGVHMVGERVGELAAEAQLITNWEALPSEVAALIHPHPTLSEAVGEAHLALAGKPLHSHSYAAGPDEGVFSPCPSPSPCRDLVRASQKAPSPGG